MRKLTLLPLALLIISAIDSNRNLPAAAIFGSPLIFYFIFAAFFFLIPTALVSAELASVHPKKEGIYFWVRHAFGEKWGMVAIWLQWINAVVFFPTILSFIAGALAYLFDPALIENKTYMIFAISLIFWSLTLLNLRGLHTSARANNILTILGTLIPVIFLILLGFLWTFENRPRHLSFSLSAIIPPITKFNTWVVLEAIVGSFLGMELTAVHISNVKNPQTTFPRALLMSAVVILITMLLGALTIAIVIPSDTINLAGGIMQVFDAFFQAFHLGYLIPVMTILIVLGSSGGLINWMISPSRGLLFAASHGFLPRFFTQLNKHGVAPRILITQAIIVTGLCGILLFIPTVNAFYWLLTALSTGLYMLMYFLMFFSAIRLRKSIARQSKKGKFIIPGGKLGLWVICLFGIFGATLTFFFGFVPPNTIDVGSPLRYILLIAGGNLLFVLPVLFTFAYKARTA